MSLARRIADRLGVRESPLYNRYLAPIRADRGLRAWWRLGRPAPSPHSVKLAAILHWSDLIGATTLVETGTYRGDTVRALRDRYQRLVSIELSADLARLVAAENRGFNTVEIHVGDSGALLPAITATLTTPTVFWLDAHYSGGDTAGKGDVPIYRELAGAVAATVPHIILIDDMRDFNGERGYPTVAALTDHLAARGYKVFVANDILQAVPRALL